jgi:hypothetical protein
MSKEFETYPQPVPKKVNWQEVWERTFYGLGRFIGGVVAFAVVIGMIYGITIWAINGRAGQVAYDDWKSNCIQQGNRVVLIESLYYCVDGKIISRQP